MNTKILYSPSEVNYLRAILRDEPELTRGEQVQMFCKKYKRTPKAVMAKIYKLLDEDGGKENRALRVDATPSAKLSNKESAPKPLRNKSILATARVDGVTITGKPADVLALLDKHKMRGVTIKTH